MYQNTKKTTITHNRWAAIIEFMYTNESNIKSMLSSAVCPEMVRVDIMLDNVAHGSPALSTRIVLPEGDNSIHICSLLRPKLFFPNMLVREIQDLSIEDMLILMANQLEVA